jgi:L-ascorbate metabolism protein UlaG (beta-lactamase superfamily)
VLARWIRLRPEVAMRQTVALALTALLLSGSVISYGQEWPREPIPAPRIREEVRAHSSGLAVWWTGHNGWLIKSDCLLVGTDLATEDEARLYRSPITAEELAPLLDIAFITHGHGDHFNRKTARILAEQGRCHFVMPANCVEDARRLGIPDVRIKVASPRQPFELKGVKISPLRAIHGNSKSAVYFDANLEDCGYLIELGGRTFLQPGDSVLLEDHLFLKHVDVLFFSPTEHNMHIDPSVILINELDPEYILPQHRDTYRVTPENRFWTSGYPHEVKLRLSGPFQTRYHILKQGQKLEIERASGDGVRNKAGNRPGPSG